ncbi:hypothetical protein IP90_01051 [Luteimonas cucumeris]|uniref:Uncharacterized protein n=1 Tax=Luteimonas cucumeris TaxID=985012 RepID=A0A562LB48_9GAMM|nr:hypothetical protein [Luteimonas cucumeris]TWI04909.1 hypothetical protein IP90_01051 [Luteimonas cucumeris]
MRLRKLVLAMTLPCLVTGAYADSKSTSLQIGIRIVPSCTIHSLRDQAGERIASTRVACSRGAPFRISSHSPPDPSPASTEVSLTPVAGGPPSGGRTITTITF